MTFPGRLRTGLWCVGLFALAFGVRCLPYATVFEGDTLRPPGNDAYYHLHRIQYCVENFPAVLDFDPEINHPHGARAIWPHSFDFAIAAVARVVTPAGDRHAVERLAMWVPPLFGAATVVVLFVIALRLFNRRIAVIAALTLGVLGGHVRYSQLGFVDHHAAVAFLSVLLVATLVGLLDRLSIRPEGPGTLVHATAFGALMGASLLVWPGCLLWVVLAEIALFLVALVRNARARKAAVAVTWVQAAAMITVLPLSVTSEWEQWSELSPTVLSLFQPFFFTVLLLTALACVMISARLSTALVVLAVLLAGSLAALSELRGALADAWTWLARSEVFQAAVAESQPLLLRGGKLTLVPLGRLTSYAVFALPILLVVFLRLERKRLALRTRVSLVVWGGVLLLLTLSQQRFSNSLSVPLALFFGWGVARVYARMTAGEVTRRRQLVSAAGLAVVSLALLAPTLLLQKQHFSNLKRRMSGESVVRWPQEAALFEVANWLKVGAEGRGAVLCNWSRGHVIHYVSGLPVVTNNFGDDIGKENFLLAHEFFRATPEESRKILEQLEVCYVVVEQHAVWHGETPGPESMLGRLFWTDGGSERLLDDPDAEPQSFPALERYRLVFESSEGVFEAGEGEVRVRKGLAAFKVYEIVEGAEIVGRTFPGETVYCSLGLKTNRGRETGYRAMVRANSHGYYRFRVPYATSGARSAVRNAPRYQLMSRNARATIALTEKQVRGGAQVQGPDFTTISEDDEER